MSREASKKAAKELLALCETEGVKMPTNIVNAMVEAGTMLNATRENVSNVSLMGEFQLQKALAELVTKFGRKDGFVSASKKRKADSSSTKKSAAAKNAVMDSLSDAESDGGDIKTDGDATKKAPKKKAATKPAARKKVAVASDDEDAEPKAKKARAKLTATNSANQELADAFAELSGFEFKRGEKFKGGTWSKVAKAVRDAEDAITSGKQAMKLKGIGKSSATKIDEFLETGTMATLEEYRAGNM